MKSTILCLVLLFTVLGCGNDDGALAPYIVGIDPTLEEIDPLVLKHPGRGVGDACQQRRHT